MPEALQEERECKQHGLAKHKLLSDGVGKNKRWQCVPCLRKRQQKMRLNKKLTLVEEAGGKCRLCGYDRCYASLEFHHLDPSQKTFKLSFAVARHGWEQCREEAKKCVLVCSNCHGEIEAGYKPTLKKLKLLHD